MRASNVSCSWSLRPRILGNSIVSGSGGRDSTGRCGYISSGGGGCDGLLASAGGHNMHITSIEGGVSNARR